MKIVVFGLSISSAWGNGHATLLRGLFKALRRSGHEIHFFERDTPYYAVHRDVWASDDFHLHLYRDWNECQGEAKRTLANSDVGMVTSYCPDGIAASDLVLNGNLPRTVFYDMDSPVTLAKLEFGGAVAYIPGYGLSPFDLVLSYTGGRTLSLLRDKLGARQTATLYGWVDPDVHKPVSPDPKFAADLSYLGTYSADRHSTLEALMIETARRETAKRFVIGGAMYPDTKSWPENIGFFDHIAPPAHSAFYSSSPLTLNVTRASMAAMGYCPSGRLFEAAACGTAILSDGWDGLGSFFRIGEEILLASNTTDAVSALCCGGAALRRIGLRARERTLDCHTASIRAERLIGLLESPRNEATDPTGVEEASMAGKGD